MKPFQSILVPVDFSKHSKEALHTAADLSARYDAAVTIVHVFEPVAFGMPDGFILHTPEQLANLMTDLDKLLAVDKRDAESAGARRVETKQLQGIAAAEIIEQARKQGADLIVMGTHGRTGIGHVLLGSVTERVLRGAPCPVLSVKAPETST